MLNENANRFRKPVGVTCVLLLSLSLGRAQEQTEQNVPSLRTQSNVVFVPALVKDKAGKLVFGLQDKDFIIEDDGVEQQVSMDEAEPQEAVSLVVAIQIGRTAIKEFKRIKGLSALLDQIVGQPQVETAVVTFDSEVNLLQDFTFDSEQTESHIKGLKDGDRQGAAIYDAVRYSVNILNKRPQDSRHVLLLISETRDHGSHAVTLDDAIAAVSDTNTVVYTLAFSPTVSNALDTLRGDETTRPGPFLDVIQLMILARQALRKNAPKGISNLTGGEYELFKSRKSFENFMMDFANHLHSRYLLRFEPKNPRPGLHDIRVRLREPQADVVLARRSYWVEDPNKPPQ